MKLSVRRTLVRLASAALALSAALAHAQGVTTGSITGEVVDAQKQVVPGASIVAVHEPSGTRYEATTRADGRFSLPGMRVGGPYTVTASLTGFQSRTVKDVVVSLGVAIDLDLTLGQAAMAEEVTVTAQSSEVFSSARTGAATAIRRDVLATIPTINDRFNDYARLSPQYSGGPFGGSFVGQDNRLNNITVDGSYFNNSFGLGGQPGDRTGVTPISTAAIEEIQINSAPYDVRQGHFVGVGMNTVTRSGANQFHGSGYYWWRDQGLVGTQAAGNTYNPGTFDYKRYGAWLSGPILKDKLFFFGSYENDKFTQPGTTFVANSGGQTVGGNTTRVLASDLDALSTYLKSNFGYDTGPYQNYSFETPAKRYLGKIDYNINSKNKVSVRYLQLDSQTPVLLSNSSSLGFGNRRSNTTGLNFANSNYAILENIKSVVGEWNSILSSNAANSFVAGYTTNDESRPQSGNLFPFVDILKDSTVYTSFGYEPFTPDNQLRYHTFQAQDNFTWSRGTHTFTFGGTVERYHSDNVFFPGSQSVYVYNSLADFYTDANGYLANPNRTTSPVKLSLFQVRWNNIPGQTQPLQPLDVWYGGVYAQDEWQAARNFKLTYGLRLDVSAFGDTGYDNANADTLTFRDAAGNPVQYDSGKLPDTRVLWSPRLGFNWDVSGNRTTQVRGGTGLFSGPPIYVWISNQVGNTGTLTGFAQLSNTTARPWNPNPDAYKPTTVTGAPPPSYELALTDPNFKFPQVWRNNVAVDRRLPWDLVATGEFIYSKDINGISYINANLPAAQTALVGADNRPRWTNNRINANVTDNTVLGNQNTGYSWHASATIQKTFHQGFLKAAYSYGVSRNTVDPGSIAYGSWTGNQISRDPNNPPVANTEYFPGNRVFVAGSYRFDYLKFGATTFSFFWQGYNNGVASYTYAGDLNGDGGTGNDLLYIPRNQSEMNFQTFTSGGKTYTAAAQAAAWDAYINQDGYLSQHRGQYAERNGVLLPMVFRLDFSVNQDLFKNLGGAKHTLSFRADFLNFSNLLNHNWGVGQRLVGMNTSGPYATQPLTNVGVNALGQATYRLRVVNGALINHSLETTAFLQDVYQVQFSLKYTFN
ncbi:MAG TPA: carboxypeptidase regulatory-like domain-containing protein [Vicinamibacteria bacterium]|nr:carboxypeptidase regulatory-like domain-containing protein [Vicinamibacteria bacterium]